jgi:hypothetical protein
MFESSQELNPAERTAYTKALDEALLKDEPTGKMDNLNAFETMMQQVMTDKTAKNTDYRKATEEMFNMQRNSNAAITDPQKRLAAYVGATGAKSALTNSVMGS